MAKKQLPEDFKDFIKSLNELDVQYLLVGGWAVGIYGNPRATKDIDFLISIEDKNIAKRLKALHNFGGQPVEPKIFKSTSNI